MDYLALFISAVDPFLIAPYRWLGQPLAAWYLGTFILCIWATILTEITLAGAFYLNRKRLREVTTQTYEFHERSMNAKVAGDEKSFKAINRLANDAFGKTFFLQMAMGMASLWPAFLGAAWLQERFGEVVFFKLPGWLGGHELGFVAPYAVLYIVCRIIFTRLRTRIPGFKQLIERAGRT